MTKSLALLPVFLLFAIMANLAYGQGLTPDEIDFSTIDGWDDLRSCLKDRLNDIAEDVGCTEDDDFYYTNGCLCRPSTLGSAVQIIQEKTMDDCQNTDDKNLAKTILLNWCSSKGYTSVATPASQASATGGSSYPVTTTVTQGATSTVAAGSVVTRTVAVGSGVTRTVAGGSDPTSTVFVGSSSSMNSPCGLLYIGISAAVLVAASCLSVHWLTSGSL